MADDDQAQGDADYYNDGNVSVICPAWAPIIGFAGITFAVTFASKSLVVDISRQLQSSVFEVLCNFQPGTNFISLQLWLSCK